MSAAPRNQVRNRKITVGALLAVMAVMFALVGASVPLYRLFCQATGYGGTTQRADRAPASDVANRLVTVRFDAQTAPDLNWEFRPLQASVQVHPGDEKVIYYRAVNRSKETLTGTATFNVTPYKVGLYFDKLQCFCFTRQVLRPGESRKLGVSFFVDPDIVKDHNADDVDTITLSYTMFRAKPGAEPLQSSALR